ncbi:MAG: DUF3460 family protein [Sterolibacterium sp.]|nr:DUF3460 family protein [Sterolibacterium sp.]
MNKNVALRYESEHTRFMREWLQNHPEQSAVKLTGRQLWWDRGSKSLDEMRRIKESRAPQKAYVYYDWNE